MNSSSIFSFSAKSFAELKVHCVKSIQLQFYRFCCCIGGMCLAFQAHATNPAPAKPADTNAPAATTPAAPAAPAAAAANPGSGTFDMSKVPFVTAASRPGLFMLPPTTPG
ncbi:hypothetical protein C8R34_1111, partial [Nitrosomonas sp. Nm84]